MGKNKKKSKLDDAFVDSLTASGGWQTGPVTAMAIDEPEHAEPAAAAAAPSKGAQPVGMQLDGPSETRMSKKLKVAKTSMKRGQRTKIQRLRKASKLEKAMARVEKSGVRVDGSKSRRLTKLSLKHMY